MKYILSSKKYRLDNMILVPHTVWTYPQAIPAIYIADCIDWVKDLWKDMEYKHYPDENLNEIITYAQYNTNETTDVGLIYLTWAIYQNRQKYLAAWTQKRWSHLPSAFSYITSWYASASDSDWKFLIWVDRWEYQVACDVGKFWAVTYNWINQYIWSNDDIDEESILLSAIGETTGASWGRRIRLSGSNGCWNQSYALATNRNGTLSARFVVRP